MNRKNFFATFCFQSVVGIAFLFTSWILFLRLDDGLQILRPKVLLIEFLITSALVSGIWVCRTSKAKMMTQPKFCVFLVVLACVMGIGARLAFLSLGDGYLPDGQGSDTGIHWYIGQEILETGEIQSRIEGLYEAFFTYLISYTRLMSIMMKIFGVSYIAVLIPNIISDLVAAMAIYMLLNHWKGRKAASFAVVLWMLNPLGIVFCAEGLALSITNMFIAMGFWCIYFFWQAFLRKDFKKFLLWVAGIGLVFAFGNAFRILFPVFLIALVILLFVYCVQNFEKKNVIYTIAGVILIAVTMTVNSFFITKMQQSVNPYYIQKHQSSGWSIFVGANFESYGRWSFEDWNCMPPRLYESQMLPEEINREFMNMAIERYQAISPDGLVVHILNKTKVLFARNDIAIFKNLDEQFSNVSGSEDWFIVINQLGLATLTVFAALQFLFIKQVFLRKQQLDWYLFFVLLCFCGLLLSSLCVEVMSRYVSVFLTVFVIFGACALSDQENHSMQTG